MAVSDQPTGGFSADPAWLGIDLEGPLDEWAQTSAASVYAATRLPHDDADLQLLADQLVHVGEPARSHPVDRAFVYCPEPVYGPRCVLEISSAAAPPGSTLDAVVGHVVVGPEERLGQPEISIVQTASGDCRRVLQRVTDELDQVFEWNMHLWLLGSGDAEQPDVVITASAMFADLTLARVCVPAIDEFVTTFTIDRGRR